MEEFVICRELIICAEEINLQSLFSEVNFSHGKQNASFFYSRGKVRSDGDNYKLIIIILLNYLDTLRQY